MRNKTKKIKQILDNGKTVYWWLERSVKDIDCREIKLHIKTDDIDITNVVISLQTNGTMCRYRFIKEKFPIELTKKNRKIKVGKSK